MIGTRVLSFSLFLFYDDRKLPSALEPRSRFEDGMSKWCSLLFIDFEMCKEEEGTRKLLSISLRENIDDFSEKNHSSNPTVGDVN